MNTIRHARHMTEFSLMQAAVDIVHDSPHPTSKVAATLAGTAPNGQDFHVTSTNYWPPAIQSSVGTDIKIGNASGTLHAEMGCIIKAPCTRDAAVFATDPPCPNCMKYMAESGVKTLYIDHKGFHKDFAKRRGDSFTNMSLRICERAGISVFELWRKDQKLEPILITPEDYHPPVENPAQIHVLTGPISHAQFIEYTQKISNHYSGDPYAVCLVIGVDGTPALLSANVHPIIGYTSGDEDPDAKYSFFMQPVNRLITNAARKGMRIDPDFVWSSRVPTSRELVNMIGAGLTRLAIGDTETCRDEWGLKALRQLTEGSGVIRIV